MEPNILIIDDDPQILKLLSEFIEKIGYSAETAATAEEGLAKYRGKFYEIVLLDIMLPDGDGVSILKQIQKISPGISVIMITGVRDIEIATECMRSGAIDYITKPFDMEYLRTTILSYIYKYSGVCTQ